MENLITDISKFIQSNDYKERLNAVHLLSKIKNEDEFKKVVYYLVRLLHDENSLIKVSALNSIKKIINENPNIISLPEFKKLMSHAYILTFTQNKIVLNALKSLINLIPEKVIEDIINELTYQIYSKDGVKRALVILKISAISLYHPEYLKNTLPEIIHLLINDKLRLIQIIIASMLDEFKEPEAKLILSKISRLKYIPLNVDGFTDEETTHPLINMYFGSKHIEKDEFKKVLEFLGESDLIVEILSLSVVERNVDMLFELYTPEEIRGFINDILDRLYCRYEIVKIISYLTLSKIITHRDTEKYLDKELINNYLSILLERGHEFLIEGHMLVKCYILEALSIIYTNSNSSEIKKSIKKFVNRIEIKELVCSNQNCYVFLIFLLASMNENVEDYLAPNVHPDFDEKYIQELKGKLFSKIFRNIELKLNSDDWVDRLVSSKLLGNILYAYPYHINEYYAIVKNLLSDNVWIIRSKGSWILRIINHKKYYIPKHDLIEIFECIYDWYSEVVIEHLLLYANILGNDYSNVIKDENLRNSMLSSIIMTYLVNDNKIVKSLAKYLLNKFPEVDYVMDYFEKDDIGKLEILENLIENPAFRKPVFTKIKLWLNKEIKANNDDTIVRILKFIDGKYFTSTAFILYELIKLYDRYDIAKEIIDTIQSKYSEILEYYFTCLCKWIDKYPIPIKRKTLKEILEFTNFGIKLSDEMLNKLKELVIYEMDEESLEVIMEILNTVGDEEGKLLVIERKSLDRKACESIVKNIVKNKDITKLKEIFGDRGIILKVIILDNFINLIENEDSEFIEFLNNYSSDIFEQICPLIDIGYYIILEKIKKFMVVLIISNPGLFRSWMINNYHKIQEKCINFLKKILKEPYPEVKIELLDILEDALNEGYYELVYKFLPELSELLNYRMWEVKSRALKLIIALNVEKEDVDDVVVNILKSFESPDEDFRLYLLRALKNLPTSRKHGEKVIGLLEELKPPGGYLKSIVNDTLRKYRGDM
ncbi:hypothetical protein [Methanotorris formicicus]|uniref:Uncharacterized protein n=1 Tax=Methanotorris formicicus Mc-S-70 TaxID=647171 RepID=H1L0H1_9EURY|nr:hypothetical protein [Methanotorris formicicus]EHP84866.1 hypothetical protein MetfoDRAFT_1545 [Methanotorris formicicus Mc-S-70]